eukprot:5485859-Amphidinium_carterae.1
MPWTSLKRGTKPQLSNVQTLQGDNIDSSKGVTRQHQLYTIDTPTTYQIPGNGQQGKTTTN